MTKTTDAGQTTQLIPLWVFAGGALGAAARYLLEILFAPTASPKLVLIVCINLVGSFLLGFFSNLLSGKYALLINTGAIGAFTTYSTFALLAASPLWPLVTNTGAAQSFVTGSGVYFGTAAAVTWPFTLLALLTVPLGVLLAWLGQHLSQLFVNSRLKPARESSEPLG